MQGKLDPCANCTTRQNQYVCNQPLSISVTSEPIILFLIPSYQKKFIKKKSRIRETPNPLTDVDGSTATFFANGIAKGADRIFFGAKQTNY